MKIVHESIFSSALRAFFSSFFAVVGILFALMIACVGLYALYYYSEEETYSADVKLLPDASGKRKELSATTPVILQIDLAGIIGKEDLTAKKIEKILLKSREDELKEGRVKAILLTIDSPGGSGDDSDKIYRLLKQYKQDYQVPIFAYIDGMCASGGYYIACAADKIYASDISIIGSIGVIAWPPFINVSDALEKIGVNSMTLHAGKGKDEMNPLRPWKPGEQENYQKLIDYYYTRFTQIVSSSRPSLDSEKLIQVYGAGVFPSAEACQIGFIDACSYSRNDALKELVRMVGISENQNYQVITFETKGWFEKLLKEDSFLGGGKIKHEFLLPGTFKTENHNPFYYLFSP